jgi:ATP-dependent RNA helicase RhlE
LSDAGYERPTDIQTRAIPPALEGRDVLGAAQTGTGKTAAFVLPILHRMERELKGQPARDPRALVIAPTRELALQIREGVETYGRHTQLRCTVVYGGVSVSRQADELARGTDVLVATPGRLVDLMGQGAVDLTRIEYLVLDEVDRMLDQGFWPAIRRIVGALPNRRQTLLFSATMPDALRPLADKLLVDPVRVSVAKVASTPDRIEQRVWHVQQQADKRPLLNDLLSDSEIARAIVFTKTKHGANRVADQLVRAGIQAAAIHGNKSQNARERALSGFRAGTVGVLVATDLAARGIDVDDVTHVINYDLPMDPESYVHRIGRTARAGQSGKAFSFCASDERPLLSRIERLIGRRVPQA